jgi:hypothetical protein
MQYEVTSPMAQDRMMQLLVDGVDATEGWNRVSEDAYRWQATLENRAVVLAFMPQPLETAGTFALEVTLEAQAAAD